MTLKEHVYEFDEVVIGLTIPSLLYAYIYNLPIVYKFRSKPKFFEFIDNSVNLTKTGLLKDNKQLSFPKGKLIKAYSSEKVLDHLYFINSISGKIPFKDNVSELYLEDNNILKIITSNQRLFRYKFNRLRIFDTRELNFLEPIGNNNDKIYVLDEFNVEFKTKKSYDIIPTDIEFPKEIYTATDRKRLMSYSVMTREQLLDPNYSSFFITKQIESIFSSYDIKAKVEWVKRYEQEKDPLEYETQENIIIDKRNEEEIWKLRKIDTYHIWSGSFRSRVVQKMMDFLGQMH